MYHLPGVGCSIGELLALTVRKEAEVNGRDNDPSQQENNLTGPVAGIMAGVSRSVHDFCGPVKALMMPKHHRHKPHCSRCGERFFKARIRCPRCDTLIIGWPLATAGAVVLLAFLLLLKFLGFF